MRKCNKKKPHQKFRCYLIIYVVSMLVISITGTSAYTEGIFWSRLDNTLVLTNTNENVSIGKNETISTKLFVDGTTLINGSLITGENGLGYNILFNSNTSNKVMFWQSFNNQLSISDKFTVSLVHRTLIFPSVWFDVPFTVGVDSAGHDVLFYSDTTNKFMKWDTTLNKLVISGETECLDALNVYGISNFEDEITIDSNISMSDEGNIFYQSYDKVGGFPNWFRNPSSIYFVLDGTKYNPYGDNTDIAGRIWYDNRGGIGDLIGMEFEAKNFIFSTDGGTGDFSIDGELGLNDNDELRLGYDSSVSEWRSEIYGNQFGLFINPLNWGVGAGTDLPKIHFNSQNLDTDFIVNTDIGQSLFIDGTTGDINIANDFNVTGIINNSAIYAQLSDSTDQTFNIIDTGQAITFNTNDEINNIAHSIISDTENITINVSGVYSIFVQPQVHANPGASGYFHMWLRQDTGSGFVDIPNTNVELTLDTNNEDVITLIISLHFDAGDVIRVNASVAHTGIELDYQAPVNEPAIPSIIFSMYRIGS